MKVFAAKWIKTTPTVIRVSDLWNKDADPGEETKKNKFNRLFSELREEATAEFPEGTREARLSTLPLIDARYNEAHTALMALLNTWIRNKDEELRKSGAAHETTGILFKDYGDGYAGEDAHDAYLILLDQIIVHYYHDAKDAYDIAVAAGGYSGGWTLSNWEAERSIASRHGQLLDQARIWMRPSLAEIAILRPMSDYENLVRARAGKTIESATAWATLETKFFQAALDVVNELGKRVYDGAPEDVIPPELKTAERLLRSRPAPVLEEGQLLPLLNLPCSEVNEILDSLDAILPQILDGSETAKTYNRTYTLFHTYQQLRCAVIVSDPEREDIVLGRPTRYVKLTDSNMRGFQAVLDDYWKTTLQWAQVEKEAAQSGRSQEYQAAKTTAYDEIKEAIVKIQDDPWGGPLGRDPSGKIVPYSGIGIGHELYNDWIRTMAYEAHSEIKDLFTGVEKPAAEPEVYVVTEEYVAALIKKYSGWWDSPTHGVALQPGFIQYSVLDPAWNTFEAAMRGKIGSSSLTGIEQFEEDVEVKYVEAVMSVQNEVARLRLSKADKFPVRIEEIEALVESLSAIAYTIRDASNLLAELRLLHSQVPWSSDAQARYSAIYKTLTDFIDPRGGMLKVAYPTETNAFYIDEETTFKDDTVRDKTLAEWLDMDYETELTTWKDSVWAGLVALEKRENIAEWQYPAEQEAIVSAATAMYLQWRSSLIDTARARLTSLADRLRTKTATIEDKTLAERGKDLIHSFLHAEIEELRIALEQMLPGAILPAALKPFARFEPLKSVSGFDVEEFSFKHLDKLIENWARPRIKDDLIVEPKINGYRLILQSKEDDCRIYMEGATKDYSKIYKHLAAEIKTLPTVILDGELVEEATARAELGKYRRSAVDDSKAIVYVFDILYLEDEDVHNKPYSERREILDKFFAGRSFKHLRKLPSWKVTSFDDLIAKAKKADTYPSSEGAMFKTTNSKYLLGRRTGDWSKCKRITDLQVMVLKVTKTKAGDYVYRCGVSVKDIKGIDPKEIERRGTKEYVVLGNTFRTSVVAKTGDHLEVSITELVEQEGPQGKKYNWMLPKVKDKTTRAVDTLPYAREVGQLLSASIDLPWKFLTDKLNEALATVSVPRLRALKAELFGVLADFNYIRLVRYAWNVVELIRERLGQAVDPLITNRGVEKIYEVGTVPRTTDRMLDEARSDYKVLTEDIQASPQQKAKRGGALAQILQGYVKTATGSLLALAEELLKEVQNFISILAKSGTQSIIDIDRKLAGIERRLDDLLREEPDTLAEDVASLQTELKTLIKAIGESRDLFADHIDRIFSRMEEVELPLHTSEGIRNWLRITKTLISAAIGKIPVMIEAEVSRLVKELETCVDEHGGRIAECTDIQEAWLEARDRLERAREDFPSARFLLETSIPIELTGYWDEMTDTQRSVFKEDFDGLRMILQEAKKMIKGLRGALLWAAMKPLKLDLGCGGGYLRDHVKELSDQELLEEASSVLAQCTDQAEILPRG